MSAWEEEKTCRGMNNHIRYKEPDMIVAKIETLDNEP
jgi:hypothetical protein